MLSIYTVQGQGCKLEFGLGPDGLWLKTIQNGIEYNRSELHPRLLVYLVEKAGVGPDTICHHHGIMRQGSAVSWANLVKHQISKIEVQINDDEVEE
jgi:hypothetical protein